MDFMLKCCYAIVYIFDDSCIAGKRVKVMIIKENKGNAIFMVLIVMAILTVLGSVIAFSAATEGRQTVRRYEKEQAYYYARSGVETAYKYLLKIEENGDLADFLEAYEDNSVFFSGGFMSLDNENNSDKEVHVEIHVDDEKNIAISSTGTYGSAEAKDGITLHLLNPASDFPFPVPPIDDAEKADPAKDEVYNEHPFTNVTWTNPQTGIRKTEHGGDLYVFDSDKEELKFTGGSANEMGTGDKSSFQVKNMYYLTDLFIKRGAILTFYSELSVFYDEVKLETHGQHDTGSLCFGRYDYDNENEEKHIVYFAEDVILVDNQGNQVGDIPVKKAGLYKIRDDLTKAILPYDIIDPDDPDYDPHLVPYEPEPSLEDRIKYWE